MTEKTSTKDEAKRGDAARAARAEKLRRCFPTIEELRRRARWRVPQFAFDFVDGGANDEECARRNATALSAVEPRYCIDTKGLSTKWLHSGLRETWKSALIYSDDGGISWSRLFEYDARCLNISIVNSQPTISPSLVVVFENRNSGERRTIIMSIAKLVRLPIRRTALTRPWSNFDSGRRRSDTAAINFGDLLIAYC